MENTALRRRRVQGSNLVTRTLGCIEYGTCRGDDVAMMDCGEHSIERLGYMEIELSGFVVVMTCHLLA